MKLVEKINAAKEFNNFPAVPDYISDNLAYELRDYQTEAISRYLYYQNSNLDNKSSHLLWQMATGSGKTLIMAALIIEMYSRGYRNFWFFVTSKDIITKTKDNFINYSSQKYQFSDIIEIDGRRIEVREVNKFEESVSDSINIKFSTVNILHQVSLLVQEEDSISLNDFIDTPVIFLADEAHHFSAATKSRNTEVNT